VADAAAACSAVDNAGMVDPVGGSPAYPPLHEAPGFVPSVPPPADGEPEPAPALPDPPPLGSPGPPVSVSEAVARYLSSGGAGGAPPDGRTDLYA